MEEFRSTNYRPTKKVSAAAAVGAVLTLVIAVAAQFGVELESELVAALNTVLMIGAAYLVSDGKIVLDGDIEEIPPQGEVRETEEPSPVVVERVRRSIEENPPEDI